MSTFYNDAIFWVEVEKIKPNPFQPRKEFDEAKLSDLAKSIRQYGVIQPLTVTRKEFEKPDGGMGVEYELIAGERRLRASKIAGLREVPVLIRTEFEDDKTKLEVAIIENLQREDLNPIDRAKAFYRLVNEFGFKHVEVAEKVGKSREYVSNTLRLLLMSQEMQDALADGKITEGHTRPLLMLIDRPEEQQTLFKEIMLKRLTVRDTESIARRIAYDKVRKKEYLYSPDVLAMEKELTEALGTRVAIEQKDKGGKVSIDFMSEEDLRAIFSRLAAAIEQQHAAVATSAAPTIVPQSNLVDVSASPDLASHSPSAEGGLGVHVQQDPSIPETPVIEPTQNLDDRTKEEKEIDENTFDASNFSI